jgi:energy-converting hydrogenase A subunit G
MHIIGADTGKNLSKTNSVFPQPIALNMKIMTIAPNFIVLILIIMEYF